MTKATKPWSKALDATDDQPSLLGMGADFGASETRTTDLWTHRMFSNLKRMAVDESFRNKLMSFRAPTLAPVHVELRQLH